MHKEEIGDCEIWCGDNREILPLIANADLCLTDAPYGIDYGRAGGFSASHGWGSWRENVDWDTERPPREIFDKIREKTKDQIFWGGNYFSDYLPPSMRWLVWDKGQRDFSLADCELAWVSQQKAARVFTYPRAKALQDVKKHPTQKPVALMLWCLGFFKDAKTVIDPWLGSGTSLVACAKLGRKGIGIELDPDYFDIACKRVEEAYRQPDLFIDPPKPPTQEQMDL